MAVSNLARGINTGGSTPPEIIEFFLLKELPGLGTLTDIRAMPSKEVSKFLLMLTTYNKVHNATAESQSKRHKFFNQGRK